MLYVKKRLILDADINFDVTGTGEEETFFSSDGKKHSGRKINASHLPLRSETRKAIGAANVDSALAILKEKLDNTSSADVLEQDLTVPFQPEDSIENIQLAINAQKKNLNNHTLTFIFPASLDQILYSSIVWQDFYNGTIVIVGGNSGSKVAVYDQLNINSLFRFYRCQCEVIIRYFHFIHQYSPYGICAESSAAVIAEDCIFSGNKDMESYAACEIASDVYLHECIFNNDEEISSFYSKKIASLNNELNDNVDELTGNIEELQRNKADLSLDNINSNIDIIVEHGEGTGEDGGVLTWWWYDKYRSGKVVQGGTVTAARGALAANCSTIISFPVEFANTNYFAIGIPTSQDFNTVDATVTIKSKANENFTVYVYDTNAGDAKLDWYATGRAATE
ncbi:MAG: hypothetical protein J6W00_06790 [Lentisphaeria bacterium]|nr:hypothetical protein [Lentisphaeria bacterium]